MESVKTVKIHITGKVQGVWFRASAKEEALSIGLKGKVWNNPDQSVGVLVQGTEEEISAFIDWCKKGPPLSKVDQVMVEEMNEELKYESFEITRLSP